MMRRRIEPCSVHGRGESHEWPRNTGLSATTVVKLERFFNDDIDRLVWKLEVKLTLNLEVEVKLKQPSTD